MEVAKWVGEAWLSDLVVSLLAGIVGPFVWYFYLWIFGKTSKVTKKRRGYFFIGSFVLVSFLAYAVISFCTSLVSLQARPSSDFGLSAEPVAVAAVAKTNERPIVIVWTNIYNGGAPTITHDWKIEVSIPNEKPLYGVVVGNPEAIQFTPEEQARFVHPITPADYLPRNTGLFPIQQGYAATGFAAFGGIDVDDRFLSTSGTRFKVSFRDVRHRVYEAVYTLNVENVRLR